MKRCLQLAAKGIGSTRPNPSVGAVVVVEDTIVGEGYTSPFGGPHAEVNAIHFVKDKSLLKKATIYVTLEPCSHFGKTPPCSDLIVDSGIKNVVIGVIDNNSLVAGKGVNRLRKSGCNVEVGVLEDECYQHHKRFFTFHQKNRPYIILKWAETIDGFIAPLNKNVQKPVWISNEYSRQRVHKWRAQEHAILIGGKTVIDDNPSLNLRSWKGLNPKKIILDKHLSLDKSLNIFKGEPPVLICNLNNKNSSKEFKIDFSNNIAKQVCEVLYKQEIQSVIIEGGSKTLQSFINENLWDESRVFVGDVKFGEGVKAPSIHKKAIKTENIFGDQLKWIYND